MPYASKSQARAMHAKAERGEISAKTVKEFDKATDFRHLPEHKKGKGQHMGPGRKMDGTGENDSMDMGTDGGAPGSHEESHKQLGGHRSSIETGHPKELERFHKGGKGKS